MNKVTRFFAAGLIVSGLSLATVTESEAWFNMNGPWNNGSGWGGNPWNGGYGGGMPWNNGSGYGGGMPWNNGWGGNRNYGGQPYYGNNAPYYGGYPNYGGGAMNAPAAAPEAAPVQ